MKYQAYYVSINENTGNVIGMLGLCQDSGDPFFKACEAGKANNDKDFSLEIIPLNCGVLFLSTWKLKLVGGRFDRTIGGNDGAL